MSRPSRFKTLYFSDQDVIKWLHVKARKLGVSPNSLATSLIKQAKEADERGERPITDIKEVG